VVDEQPQPPTILTPGVVPVPDDTPAALTDGSLVPPLIWRSMDLPGMEPAFE